MADGAGGHGFTICERSTEADDLADPETLKHLLGAAEHKPGVPHTPPGVFPVVDGQLNAERGANAIAHVTPALPTRFRAIPVGDQATAAQAS